MQATLVAVHAMPRAVYTATFSPAGDTLFCGGGFWYGEAFISALETDHLARTPREVLRPIHDHVANSVRKCIETVADLSPSSAHNLGFFTISGLCFDHTGEWLAASAWGATRRYYPALLFRCRRGVIDLERPLLDPEWRIGWPPLPYATATVISDGAMWLRTSSPDASGVFLRFPLPDARTDALSLASRRIARIGDVLATGMDRSSYTRGDEVIVEAESSLVLHGPQGATLIPAPDDRNITAITASAAGDQLVTGNREGSVTWWAVDPVRPLADNPGHRSAVLAACHTAAPVELLITGSLEGEVRAWAGRRSIASWQIPEGSVRTLAAHPTLPLIAIGCKHPEGGPSPGGLYVYRLA